ncbi:MAG: twin-arginine translocase TatA/TatE family subunit [Candidatus Obscuribacterales bacterium]|nr:twin-arginine translocase TatA/TatE family subunit [Candidatus Obscuribacterales bacterium]
MLSSPVEWGIVAAAALLLFGPKKFPEIGRSLGQGIGNFKKALTDAQEQVVAGIEDTEKDSPKARKPIQRSAAPVAASNATGDKDSQVDNSPTG